MRMPKLATSQAVSASSTPSAISSRGAPASSPSPPRKGLTSSGLAIAIRFTPPPPAISFLKSVSCSRILQSCNGLLLCSSSRSNSAYFVCNPLVGRLCKVDFPNEVRIEGNWEVLGLALAFDESRWSGFKVICVSSFAIDVYSSKDEIWKRISQGPFRHLNLESEGAYLNGKAIWLTKDRQLDTGCSNYLVLDLEREKLDLQKLPCYYSMVHYFGEFMGNLHLVTMDHENFNLYEMGEAMEWELKFRVIRSVMRAHIAGGYVAVETSVWDGSWVLNVVKKEEEEGYFVMWYLPSGAGRVVTFNCKTSLVRCLSESKVPGCVWQPLAVVFRSGWRAKRSVSSVWQ